MTRSMIRKAAVAVAALAVLATSTAAMAQGTMHRLYGGRTHTFTAMVYAGVPAEVVIDGDGDPRADLDLFVYDQYGRLVAVDDDYTDYCIGRWMPTTTGPVTIRVVNVGSIFNDYRITSWIGLFR